MEEVKEDIEEEESMILEPGIVGPNKAIGYQDTHGVEVINQDVKVEKRVLRIMEPGSWTQQL